MAGLKVVALISGGKDSLFSILHCIANGHEVVALANLHPPSHHGHDTAEDLDSYMYQTVGHAAIPLYEKALQLPLYRQEILGTPVNRQRSYAADPRRAGGHEDETESLVPLLRSVMAAQPEVNAVSTGAILSDYQRTRVESVALRLRLTPLSYLWQYPHLPPHTHSSLLEAMAAVGQDSRIIKVASGGLDDSFLWHNVADRQTLARLTRASQRFGSVNDGAVLGEGGEYETLAVDGPPPLWKARIVVDDAQREIVSGEAGSVSIRVLEARLVEKTGSMSATAGPRIPPLLDDMSRKLFDKLSRASGETSPPPKTNMKTETDDQLANQNTVLISNMTGSGANATEQMASIMNTLTNRLSAAELDFNHIAYTSIVLRNMADFPLINAVYGSFFTHPDPPSRVTLSCADLLPPAAYLAVSVTSVRPPSPGLRKGLHVQSRSYWTPANIGPYSQAISVPLRADGSDDAEELVYVAGQIPLVPATMELVGSPKDAEESFVYQAVLALQHLRRIGDAVRVRSWVRCLAFVTACSDEEARTRASVARRAWDLAHQEAAAGDNSDGDEDESFDIWHVRHDRGHANWQARGAIAARSPVTTMTQMRPVVVLRVDALPRDASIEWAAYGSTGEAGYCPAIPHYDHLLHVFSRNVI